jgi:acyl-CoA reductase-like NAD-dependent aldehyde dehydrogenase
MEMLIDGAWVAARSGATFAAGSPATGEPIGEVPEGDREDARRAITAANRAADAWGRTTAFERAAAMHRVADAIEEKRLERPSRELRLTRKASAPGASAARSHRRDHAFELAVHDARGTNRVGARLWQHGRVDTCIHDCGGRDRALERGAKVVAGGSRASGLPTRLYWEATILDDVRHSLVAQEETFGHVAPVVAIDSLQHAIELVNASPYSLLAAIFTRDLARGLEFADHVRTGLGERQRAVELLGEPPSIRRPLRQRERHRTSRRNRADGVVHRAADHRALMSVSGG